LPDTDADTFADEHLTWPYDHRMTAPIQVPLSSAPLVSVVLPCLNEEAALGACLAQIKQILSNANIPFEIVVCDNGSTDNSVEIARGMNVRLVHEAQKGYGRAYLKGFSAAQGRYLVMGDADATYDFTIIPALVEYLKNGYDFVTGSRYENGIKNLPFLRGVLGNPGLTALVNALFGSRYSDVYCGLRAFSREAFDRISPTASGMEFNLELAIRAHLLGLKIKQVPIELSPRLGESKLSIVRDGLRSLIFIIKSLRRQ
jgi:glycosyltransferase involved in cell wall biosynthesis